MAGGGEEAAIENGANILDLIHFQLHLVHKTPVKDFPPLALLCLALSKNFPPIYRASLKKKIWLQVHSKANQQMWSSVTSVQRPSTQSMRCAPLPPPLTAASAWLYQSSSNGFFRHEKQGMTCAKQWQADDEPAPFDDGPCRCGRFFDVEEYRKNMIHQGCTGGPGSNESHFVQL